jgi:hypothetical protein
MSRRMQADRVTAETALQHPYFAEYHDPEDEPVAERSVAHSFDLGSYRCFWFCRSRAILMRKMNVLSVRQRKNLCSYGCFWFVHPTISAVKMGAKTDGFGWKVLVQYCRPFSFAYELDDLPHARLVTHALWWTSWSRSWRFYLGWAYKPACCIPLTPSRELRSYPRSRVFSQNTVILVEKLTKNDIFGCEYTDSKSSFSKRSPIFRRLPLASARTWLCGRANGKGSEMNPRTMKLIVDSWEPARAHMHIHAYTRFYTHMHAHKRTHTHTRTRTRTRTRTHS